MRKILLAEATLSREAGLSFKERLEVARLLDSIGVDIIETCPVGTDKADEILIKTIAAQTAGSKVSCPVTAGEVEAAWNAVSGAVQPRLNVKLPVSVVQIEYICQKKPEKMLEYISECVSKAAALCGDVEFTCLDATRADEAFLAKAISAAIEAGAQTVTLSDDAGDMLPVEFGAFVKKLYATVPELSGVTLGIAAGDRLSMAEACAYEAVKAGAGLVYARAKGRDMPALKTWTEILNTKGEQIGAELSVDITALKRTADRINGFSKVNSLPVSAPAEAVQLPVTVLDTESDIESVARAAVALGYELSGEDLAKVYERFRSIAKRKPVDMRELDAIIASAALQVPPTYTLSSYVINSGNIITATAHVVLDKNGEMLQGISTGDGPIDAALMAIEKLIGHHYELDDFRLQSVTGGQEAMGEALVRLRDGGVLYSGRGTSTDIIGASIRAYINALNKIVYKGE